ncbi:hypothetical protein N0V93_004444 [Gnomoniopsis smithogilvyi]|uniref:lytic cellulose monooxygenase (C4-dehydrogenating) n=1 Tax=Gnomoniopsis smithogilvyi TaxID=1191159 RepID=A0A9W9CX36_9PEZI|nr:hypothetical protein N0V93_004444 [Gnomoniopsis smithogilvyi]
MRYTPAVIVAAFVASASAHTRIYSAWVNGEDQGDGRGTYIRSPPTNDPVKDVTSADLVCNVAGATAVSDFVSAAAGDTITMEWYHDSRGDDIIASSHKGPIITYIAEYFEDAGASAIWTKIAEQGYDSASDTWAVDDLISAGGKIDFTLPSNIKAGKYMVRQEIIALHEADTCYATAGSRGAQFYPSCVQFEVTGTGTATPDEAFDFNANYSCDVPGIEFNLYGEFTSYEIPGPAAESSLGGSSSSGSSDSSSSSSSASASAAVTSSGASPSGAANAAGNAAAPTTLATSTTSAAAAAQPTAASGSGSSCSKRRKARAALRA